MKLYNFSFPFFFLPQKEHCFIQGPLSRVRASGFSAYDFAVWEEVGFSGYYPVFNIIITHILVKIAHTQMTQGE